jgi:P-type E1-E2 ATPase
VRQVLEAAAALEQYSEHPLAHAVLRAAGQRGLARLATDGFQSGPGGGLRGRVGGVDVLVGRSAWLGSNLVETAMHQSEADQLAMQGFSLVWVAIGGQAAALLVFADTLHPEARAAVDDLRRLGVQTRILSGDQEAAVSRIAGQLGITSFEAQLTPAEKLARVRESAGKGQRVAMVGDGINDGPALAAADVGIAIGTGAEVARQVAPICLVGHSPHLIAEAVRMSRQSARIMKQNLGWALGYNLVMLPVAIFTALPPQWAAAAMMFSSFSVVANALRLRKLI